jgi:hypothetical protein
MQNQREDDSDIIREFIREAVIPPAMGDCYEAAVNFVMDRCLFGPCHYTIVHAEVAGQGPLEGTNFGHAYVVDNRSGAVIDRSNGRHVTMSREAYEALGNVKEIGNYHEYEWKEVRKMIVNYEHYGPWELATSSGL